jgi:hypothetical protein
MHRCSDGVRDYGAHKTNLSQLSAFHCTENITSSDIETKHPEITLKAILFAL